jgi:hypothetical protein
MSNEIVTANNNANQSVWGQAKPTRLMNLTPHKINIRMADGVDLVLMPEATSARVASTSRAEPPLAVVMLDGFSIGGIPVAASVTEGIVGLPEPQPGVVFVTSAIVAEAATKAGRRDVLAPGTGPNDGAIRENGQVVAVTRLVRLGL